MKITRATIKTIDGIPTIPSVATRILELVMDDESSSRDVAKIIESDTALSSKILRVVNSAAYGLSQQISTLSHAISMLGFNTIRSLVLSISIFDEFASKTISGNTWDKVRFWQHCVSVATASREIAAQTHYHKPDEAYMAGMLHDLGRVVCEMLAPDDFSKVIIALEEENDATITELEQQFLGVNHAQVGGWLCDHWHLPKSLVMGVTYHHAESIEMNDFNGIHRHLCQVIAVSDFFCWAQGLGSMDLNFPPVLNQERNWFVDLKKLDTDAVLKAIDRELNILAEIFEFPMPDIHRFSEALQKANMELGRINSLYTMAKQKMTLKVRKLFTLSQAIRKARESLDMEEIFRSLLFTVRDGLGFDRAFLFQVDLEHAVATGYTYTDETRITIDLKRVRISIGPGNGRLHECAYERKSSIIFRTDALPEEQRLLDFLHTDELACIPIDASHSVIALLIVDNAFKRFNIDHVNMESLVILSHEAGMAIENARLQEQNRALSITDDLTGLHNRQHCMELFEVEFGRSRRYKHDMSVLMTDIDSLIKFNDIYGHSIGDKILQAIADIIRKLFRKSDIIGRYGGDEFLIILPETNLEQAFQCAERLRKVILGFGRDRLTKYPECTLSISIGISRLTPDTPGRDHLIQQANKALSLANSVGGNRVEVSK